MPLSRPSAARPQPNFTGLPATGLRYTPSPISSCSPKCKLLNYTFWNSSSPPPEAVTTSACPLLALMDTWPSPLALLLLALKVGGVLPGPGRCLHLLSPEDTTHHLLLSTSCPTTAHVSQRPAPSPPSPSAGCPAPRPGRDDASGTPPLRAPTSILRPSGLSPIPGLVVSAPPSRSRSASPFFPLHGLPFRVARCRTRTCPIVCPHEDLRAPAFHTLQARRHAALRAPPNTAAACRSANASTAANSAVRATPGQGH